MGTCEVCGNEYDKVFEVSMSGGTHTFDSFECAINALAPTCNHCGCRIIGHGVEGKTGLCSAQRIARSRRAKALDSCAIESRNLRVQPQRSAKFTENTCAFCAFLWPWLSAVIQSCAESQEIQ
jgi:hypothetical protein